MYTPCFLCEYTLNETLFFGEKFAKQIAAKGLGMSWIPNSRPHSSRLLAWSLPMKRLNNGMAPKVQWIRLCCWGTSSCLRRWLVGLCWFHYNPPACRRVLWMFLWYISSLAKLRLMFLFDGFFTWLPPPVYVCVHVYVHVHVNVHVNVHVCTPSQPPPSQPPSQPAA